MMLVCSQCNKNVSSRAESCPHCGRVPEGPRCPTCKSLVVEKISLGNKVVAAGLIGILSLGHLSKTFKCGECGYKW